ncbi:MAG: glutaredoxin 3 [Proteobacteria bacterium]|jgi:glutaredoxin 3|nr:glutaredoxin 3 [Pseudomonadota bacterium]
MPDVVIYCTRFCPYCVRARMLLDSKQIDYTEIPIDQQPERRAEMEQRSQRTSVPQIFIDDYHVGGCDDLFALEAAGELEAKLGLSTEA